MKRATTLLLCIVLPTFLVFPGTTAPLSKVTSTEDIDDAFVSGYAFARLGEYLTALEYYKKHVREYPDSVTGYNNMGNILYHLGLLKEAKAAYEEAIDRAPYLAVLYYNLGNVLFTENPDETFEEYKNKIESRSDYNPAKVIFTSDDAIKKYKKAIELKPSFLEAYNNLGISLQLKDQKAAIESFRKALEISTSKTTNEQNKKNSIVHFNLARLLHKKAFEEIQQLCKENERAFQEVRQENQEDTGEERHVPLNATWPNDRDIAKQTSLATKRCPEKIIVCGEDLDCKKNAVHRWRQELKAIASRPYLITKNELSSETSEKSMGTSPVKNVFSSEKIDVEKDSDQFDRYLKQNAYRFKEAIQEYRAAQQDDPYSYEAYNNIGTLYTARGGLDKAIEEYGKALRLDPYSVFAHNNLGVTFFKNGESRKGEKEFEMVHWLRKNFLMREPHGKYRYSIATGVSKGRIAERGLGTSSSMQLSQLRTLRPKGYKKSIRIMLMWNISRPFGQINIPSEMPDKLQRKLTYNILPKELFHQPNTRLMQPVVRILSVLRKTKQIGTGLLVKRDEDQGYVVTAYHNLYPKHLNQNRRDDEAIEIWVQFFTPIPTAQQAIIIWKSPDDKEETDMALLRVDNMPPEIPVADLVDSSSTLHDNEDLFIIGNPGEKRWKVTSGILEPSLCNKDQIAFSSKNGESPASGYSGGPVYAAGSGRVIGLYTGTASDKLERAIPVEKIKEILQEFQQNLTGIGEPDE